jgi:hypothetical protein
MIKNVLLGCLAVVLAGCDAPKPMMTVKFKDKSQTILIGELIEHKENFMKNTVSFDYTVSDGNLTCVGKSPITTLNVTGNLVISTQTPMEMTCDDGRTGNLSAKLTLNVGYTGLAVGTLSDGTKVRVVFGDMQGSLDW